MGNEIVTLIVGLLIGAVAAWFIASKIAKTNGVSTSEHESIKEKLNSSKSDFAVLQSQYDKLNLDFDESKKVQSDLQNQVRELDRNLSDSNGNLEAIRNLANTYTEDIKKYKKDLADKTDEFNKANEKGAGLSADNNFLKEKLETQKIEVEAIRKQFNLEFENIATKILDDKTKKFTDLNKDNLETILKPLGKDLDTFKKKVEEVYDKESKERFSLGKEVEKLVLANEKISEEANNLTKALTSNSKTQGDWGQMILESILEKSGLAKDREYLVQEYLKDDNGNYHVNEEGNKMQPDVIMVYPDSRKIIVDSKVSLTAYVRHIAAESKEDEEKALLEHLKSIRKHIDDLSAKSYQDFAPTLDFVMLFIPIEPAYLTAIQKDPELWYYAYRKRIILTSPTNLMLALKMLADFWKRDIQSKNYGEIVERGGKLHDKFANLLSSIQGIGTNLQSANKSYNAAISQLSEGNDNLLKQVDKLKKLGANTKKELPEPHSIKFIEEVPDHSTLKLTAEIIGPLTDSEEDV